MLHMNLKFDFAISTVCSQPTEVWSSMSSASSCVARDITEWLFDSKSSNNASSAGGSLSTINNLTLLFFYTIYLALLIPVFFFYFIHSFLTPFKLQNYYNLGNATFWLVCSLSIVVSFVVRSALLGQFANDTSGDKFCYK